MTVEDVLRELEQRRACLKNGCRAAERNDHILEFAVREAKLNMLEDIIQHIEKKNQIHLLRSAEGES